MKQRLLMPILRTGKTFGRGIGSCFVQYSQNQSIVSNASIKIENKFVEVKTFNPHYSINFLK